MSEEQTPYEWKGKPANDAGATIVTKKMIAAGREAFEAAGEGDTDWLVELVYRAMAAEAPPQRSSPPSGEAGRA